MKETIKLLREQNNYSQNSIATFLGISRQMYIKYEQGVIAPPVKVVKDLANFYRVPYEYIIDDKLAGSDDKKSPAYKIDSTSSKVVSSPTPSYGVASSDYLASILNMLPKLIYSEQLQLLSKLCDMVKTGTEEKEVEKAPSKKMQAFQRILKMNEELHLCSDGTKFTREELHERH